MRGRSTNSHAARGRIVHIQHRRRRGTGDTFRCAVPIGVTGLHANCFACLSSGQGESAGRSAADGFAIGEPLITNRAQPIRIRQRIRRCQQLALRGRSANRHAARGCVVRISNRTSSRTGDTFRRAL